MEKVKQFLFQNTSTKQTVAKNTLWLFFGEMVGRILKLTIVIFATRQLGVDEWGVFSYGLAFVSFFYILGDLGINTFIAREMSKDTADNHQFLGISFILKLGILLILFIVSLILGPHLGNIDLGIHLLVTLSILYFSDCLREFALSINRSLGKMEREAFSKIVMNVIITILGIILIIKNATPLSLAIAYAAGSSIASLYTLWVIRHEFKGVKWNVSKESIKIIYKFSWPIIIIGLFSFVFNVDSIMLGQMRSAGEVGLYTAAQRIVQFMTIIPGLIAVAIFPALSRNESDDKKFAGIFEKIMVMVFGIGIPTAIGGLLVSSSLMPLLFGSDYATGGSILGILMISTLAMFPNIILTNVIFSKNLQRTFIVATIIGVTANIGLNLFLIPRYGALGAAGAVSATQLIIMIINWQKLKRNINFSIIPRLWKIILASLLMGLGIILFTTLGLHVLWIIAIAIIIYFLTLIIIKEPTLGEILSLVKGY